MKISGCTFESNKTAAILGGTPMNDTEAAAFLKWLDGRPVTPQTIQQWKAVAPSGHPLSPLGDQA